MLKALDFREPDRVPRHENYWPEFVDVWRDEKGLGADSDPADYYGIDLVVAVADETAWPTRGAILSRSGSEYYERTGWGAVVRKVDGAQFFEEMEVALPTRIDPDRLEFDDPLIESRYEEAGAFVEKHRDRCAVFCKTGCSYLRPAYMRGIANFLMDIAEDPGWVKAFVERVTDHIIQVGVEQIKRYHLESTGIGIFDDIASNDGPIMGLKAYEDIFFPSLQKMVAAYKGAGATKVFHHCDGYIEDVLDLWVAAGIDAVHPLEARTGMDPVKVREKYDGTLAIIGGLDNADILRSGSPDEIKRHVQHVMRAGSGGGLVIAAHSIGPDISVANYDYVSELIDAYGTYPLNLAEG